MKLIIWLVMLALAAVPLLWGHDVTQFVFCGILVVLGTIALLKRNR